MANEQAIILAVDDDKDFLEVIKTELEGVGYGVKTAKSGEEAMQQLKHMRPNLIILDVSMPGMNGMEVLSKIKETVKPMPRVVFLTNFGEPQQEAKWLDEKFAREIGAVDYIRKTDDLESIVRTVRRIVTPPRE